MGKVLDIIVDIDDVILNNRESIINIIEDVLGEKYTGKISHWDFEMFDSHLAKEMKRRVMTDELFKHTTIVKDSVESVKRLQGMGHEIYFVTAVPSGLDQLRKQQVQDIFGSTDRLIITPHKHLIKADVIIDDAPHNIENSQCTYKILFSADWNEGVEDYKYHIRTGNWKEIVEFIEQLDS